MKTVSPSGKCHTYLLNTKEHQDQFIEMVDLGFIKYAVVGEEPFYLKTKIAFHYQKSLPILDENQMPIVETKHIIGVNYIQFTSVKILKICTLTRWFFSFSNRAHLTDQNCSKT